MLRAVDDVVARNMVFTRVAQAAVDVIYKAQASQTVVPAGMGLIAAGLSAIVISCGKDLRDPNTPGGPRLVQDAVVPAVCSALGVAEVPEEITRFFEALEWVEAAE